jgi:hypothetical protein
MTGVFTHKNSYTVPRWCGMHPLEHFDGMGGCWGISQGCVEEHGRDCCRLCPFYRRTLEQAKPRDAFSLMGDCMRDRLKPTDPARLP